MDDLKKKRFDMAVYFMETEFGVHLMAFTDKQQRDEALDNIRLGLAMKADLMPQPVNDLPL